MTPSSASIGRQIHTRSEQVWSFLRLLAEQYQERGCRQQAAALTYMTLFAIVPMLTVVFTMFSMFPAFEGLEQQLQQFLFKHLLPGSGQEIESYLTEFTQQARQLTLWGIGILVVTAYLMMINIEQAFNNIWGVKKSRRGVSNFLLYWAVLSLGPMLLGMGLAMSTYLLSLRFLVDEYDAIGIAALLFNYLPWVLTALTFTLLFVAVPNCKVPLKHALAGGVLTALVWELFKDLFAVIVAQSSYRAVYGAFAIFPVFLLWVYLLWMIVLGGALFVRALSTFQSHRQQQLYPDLVAVLLAISVLAKHQEEGSGTKEQEILRLGVEVDQWHRLQELLMSKQLLVRTELGDYMLSRDLSSVSLQQVAQWVGATDCHLDQAEKVVEAPWLQVLLKKLSAVNEFRQYTFALSLKELFQSIDAVEPNHQRPDAPKTDVAAASKLSSHG